MDEFMQAVERRGVATRLARHRRADETVSARELMREMSRRRALRRPGGQYDTTINQWHTTPDSGRINASNPSVST